MTRELRSIPIPHSAMVLAAGLGTRMRPLTATMPKPLVPLAGRPLIDRVLDRLGEAGVARAIVNVHHFADQLEAHVQSRRSPIVVISDERDAVLETGGGIVKALPLLGAEPFFVHNSDAVWIEGPGRNLARLADGWDDARMDALLLVAPTTAMLGYAGDGDFAMGPHGHLTRRRERELAPFVFTGVSIAHPRLLAGAPAGRHSINVRWNAALARGRLFGLRAEGTWMHVGTPEAVAAAERCLLASSCR